MNLLDDTWAAVRTGQNNIIDFLSLVKLLSSEPEPAVLKSIAADLAYVNDYIVRDTDRRRYREWIRVTFAPRIGSNEWQSAVRTTSDLDLQAELLNIVGGIGREPQILQFSGKVAQETADRKARNTPLRAAALEIGYHSGDSSLYGTILARLRSSKNPQERIEHLQSLAKFENPQLIEHSLTLDASGELSTGEARALRSFLFQNPAARSAAWEFLEHNWAVVEKRDLVTPGLFGDLSQFCDSAAESKIDAFFQLHKLPDELKQAMTQALATIAECNGQREQLQPPLHKWLNENAASSGN
jgi:ERAP1-like C-terminal domain